MKSKLSLLIYCYFAIVISSLPTNISAAESSSENQTTFVLGGGKNKDLLAAKFRQQIYIELFKRLEIPLFIHWDIVNLRMSASVESGEVDGQMARVYEYQSLSPSQLRVNVPIYKQSFVAYTHKSTNIQLANDWKSLQGTPYTVEYRRGVIFAEMNLRKVVSPELLSTIRTIEQGLEKLKARRTDIFVHANLTAWEQLNSPKYKDDIVSSGVMATVNMYPYVHKRHRSLIPKMENTLQAMKKEGLIKSICRKVFGKDSDELCQQIE